tara:strand:+ start:293 stop:604 length:312 start_codon:yes stop_codon:yes gene_type:complete
MDKAAMQEILGIKLEIRSVFGTDMVQIALHDSNTGKDIESMKLTIDHLGSLHSKIDTFIQENNDPFFNVTENDIFRSKYEMEKLMNPKAFIDVDKIMNDKEEE